MPTGSSVGNANAFGCKFLREWSRTLRLLKPQVMLAAEDYSNWPAMTQQVESGGIGFDAVWYADFIHHLVGDGNYGSEYARLIHTVGQGGDGPLAMDYFGGALLASGNNKVVYQENHDEAGNEPYTRRTIVEAVNGAPLVGVTRQYAEARSRFAMAMSTLSAGTPMFLMGEEVGAQNIFLYQAQSFLANRVDIVGDSQTVGAKLFRFFQDIIRFRRSHVAVTSHDLALGVRAQRQPNCRVRSKRAERNALGGRMPLKLPVCAGLFPSSEPRHLAGRELDGDPQQRRHDVRRQQRGEWRGYHPVEPG